MKFETFKSGTWKPQFQYKSFLPVLVNHAWTWEDPGIHVLLEQANRALGELNAFSLIVPNVDLFIQMHVPRAPAASKAPRPASMKSS
jgi:heme A synthase